MKPVIERDVISKRVIEQHELVSFSSAFNDWLKSVRVGPAKTHSLDLSYFMSSITIRRGGGVSGQQRPAGKGRHLMC